MFAIRLHLVLAGSYRLGWEVPSAVSNGISLIGRFVPNILVLCGSIAEKEEQHLSSCSSAFFLQANFLSLLFKRVSKKCPQKCIWINMLKFRLQFLFHPVLIKILLAMIYLAGWKINQSRKLHMLNSVDLSAFNQLIQWLSNLISELHKHPPWKMSENLYVQRFLCGVC